MARALMNYGELSQMYRTAGARKTCQMLTEALEKGELKASDFSIRDCAEALIPDGREWVRSHCAPGSGVAVMESGAVDTTAFSNITGQLMINAVLAGYQSEEFVFSRLFDTVPTRLNGEKIPGITKIGDKAQEVAEGMPFPHAGVGEDYVESPATAKDGLIVGVSKEAIFFDRTGQLLQQASQVGEALGIRKEKDCIDVFIGFVNNHKWKGTTYNTYQSSTPWVNLLSGSGNALADWTDVDAAEQLFNDMLDPNTGEPILMNALTAVATPALRHALNRILNATELRFTSSASETIAPNPLRGSNYGAVTSRLLYRRLIAAGSTADQAKATWFLGDIRKAFAYMENWPITVVQAPANSDAEFHRDIVAQYKASLRGVAFAREPRAMVRVNGY